MRHAPVVSVVPRWAEHKIATEPETGGATVRLGPKLCFLSHLGW